MNFFRNLNSNFEALVKAVQQLKLSDLSMLFGRCTVVTTLTFLKVRCFCVSHGPRQFVCELYRSACKYCLGDCELVHATSQRLTTGCKNDRSLACMQAQHCVNTDDYSQYVKLHVNRLNTCTCCWIASWPAGSRGRA